MQMQCCIKCSCAIRDKIRRFHRYFENILIREEPYIVHNKSLDSMRADPKYRRKDTGQQNLHVMNLHF